jgi:NAD(P)H-flavin reductase
MIKTYPFDSEDFTHVSADGHELCNLLKVTVELTAGRNEFEVIYFIERIWDHDAQCERTWESLSPPERKRLDSLLQHLADEKWDEVLQEWEEGMIDAAVDSVRDAEIDRRGDS